MTQTTDPFAQADGSVSINPNAAPAADPFAQPGGGGDYLKPIDLLGALLLLTPIEIKKVPPYRNPTGPVVDQLTADTVVLTGEHAGQEFDAMYWSQKPVIKAAARAMRDGIPAILGTLRRVPIGDDKKMGKYATLEAFEAALDAWRMGQPEIQFAWILENFTPEEGQIARDFLAKKTAR